MKPQRKFHRLSGAYLLLAVFVLLSVVPQSASAQRPPYEGAVAADVTRDRIIAISEDYASLVHYVGPDNIDYSTYSGATCPDPNVGWKVGMKYCWGGKDMPLRYLERLAEGEGAGNRFTSGGSSFDEYCAGADCSGMASVCWTAPARYTTAGFHNISDNIDWDQLRMGDCTNLAGSHIRIFDYYTADGSLMFYESTSGGSLQLWASVQRPLARDNNYTPIRYNSSTFKVLDHPEPTITYARRAGVERIEIRWDGQADVGFRLYRSLDGETWTLLRDTADLTPAMRFVEVSGLLPDTVHLFKMTAVNTGGETIDSPVVPVRVAAHPPRVLLVDGADRYRAQFAINHTFLKRVGAALGAAGVAFDACANEAVVDRQVALGDYEAAVWILAEESTFDETFSWAEQQHVVQYLESGGRVFVSGSETGWDLDHRHNWSNWKNGHPNDRTFYNEFLRASFAADDAGTYQVAGAAGSLFEGLSFSFDDGTQGTYDVAYPDKIDPVHGGTTGLLYQGGLGGAAAVYGSSSEKGTVVNFGFGFETVYPESARAAVANAVFGYFDIPVDPPLIKSVRQTASDTAMLVWEGHGAEGFRLYHKIGSGSWALSRDETVLGPTSRSVEVGGLASGVAHSFKMVAVNSEGASGDSHVLSVGLGPGPRILVVDGYDRWRAQMGGGAHTLIEHFALALAAVPVPFDSCANEVLVEGAIALETHPVVVWMCGQESTESETFSEAEQFLVQDYLRNGGKLFVSGAEIGWDLVHKADTANDFSNGSPNDTPFYQSFLKADFLADDTGGVYSVRAAVGGPFDGLTFSFDDGTHGIYNVRYPDVIAPRDGAVACLFYGSTGDDVAGLCFTGVFPDGGAEGQLVHFGFPFEAVVPAAQRAAVMAGVLDYFAFPPARLSGWMHY